MGCSVNAFFHWPPRGDIPVFAFAELDAIRDRCASAPALIDRSPLTLLTALVRPRSAR
jgi:hypothetical protein